MTGRHLVVINPAAGRSGLALAEAVIASLRARGLAVDTYRTRAPGDATAWLATLADCPEVVIAAGGDGTLNEVINGLAGRDVTIGLIPGGTTNVLATELGYPPGAEDIAAVIAGGRTQPVYLATVNGRRFSMMTGIGYDAWVVAGVNPGIKKKFGKLAYVLSMLQQLRNFGQRRYRVAIDGVAHEAMSVVVTNGRHYGGSYTLTRQADVSQPSLQVILVQTESAVKFLGMLFMLPVGLVEKLPFIRSVAGRDIRIAETGGDGTAEPVQADGDVVTQMPAEICVESTHVRFLVPPL